MGNAGFYIYGQPSRFLHKLCVRFLIDRCVPEDVDWNGLLSLHTEGQEALLHEDFLHRLNLTSKVDAALRRKEAAELSNKKLVRSILDDLVTKLRAKFCNSARNYYLFLNEGVRKHVTMTTNNVGGWLVSIPLS